MKKVVHVSDELHARLKRHCEEKGVLLQEWVGEVLTLELDMQRVRSRVQQHPIEQIEKETLPKPEVQGGENPWESRPFWERKEKENPEEQLEENGSQPPGVSGRDGVEVDRNSYDVRRTQEAGVERERTDSAIPPQTPGQQGDEFAPQQREPSDPR